MRKKGHDPKGINIYFRQTASSFKAAHQTQAYAKINRNFPYSAIDFSKQVFNDRIQKLNRMFQRQKEKLPFRLKKKS